MEGDFMQIICETRDLVVFSHLRWDFVFQRPQHLLSRFARHRRVFYIEEPVFSNIEIPRLSIRESSEQIRIVVPYLPHSINADEVSESLKLMVDELLEEACIEHYSLWYYTPMAIEFSRHLKPEKIIFDCMDELSLFKNAPQKLIELEQELFQRADIIFTGGQSLYEAKKKNHQNIHPFPSSIDYHHFSQSRFQLVEPEDQINIPHPRIGFYGVIDERFDVDLLTSMADLRPDFHFILIGPTAKIDPEILPKKKNIHYLGKKDYLHLPLYISSWDCAMMPFARNDATRFISPTKTPEFLAAGKPVVSTSIHDVIHPYADAKLVYIADGAVDFVNSIETAMNEAAYDPEWLERLDAFLEGNSWDETFKGMAELELGLSEIKFPIKQPAYKDESLRSIGIV